MFVDQEIDYYYGEQLKTVTNQFAQIFSEMYVTSGKNDYNSENNFIRIPIYYGSPDKVVTAIKNENTQNKMLRVPMFTITLDGLAIDLDRKSGTNTIHRKTIMPLGGDIKKDAKVLYRMKPLPYTFTFNVVAMASNTNQMFQITDQILMLFDPLLSFQTSDSYYDWTKILDAELTACDLTNNRSPDTDGRILQTTFTFDVRGYMSSPANLRDNVIQKIMLRIETMKTTGNIPKRLNDVTRTEPEYKVIFDAENEYIPPN